MSHPEEGRKVKKSKTEEGFIDDLINHVVGAVTILSDVNGMFEVRYDSTLRIYISKNRKSSVIKCS